MRKILLSAVALLAAVSAKAQGTWYAVTEGMDEDAPTVVCPQGEETAVAENIEGAEFFITDGGGTWENKKSYSDKVFTANNGKDYPTAYIQGTTNGMGTLNTDDDGNLIPGSYKVVPGLIKDGSTSAHLKIVPSTKGTVYVVAKYGKNKPIWAAKIANEELEDVDYSDLSAYVYNYEGLFIQADGNYGGKVAAETDVYAALPLDVEEGYTYLFWVQGSKIMLAAIDFVTGGGETSSDTWTVAGVTSLCGSEWNPADTSNDMKSSDGVNFTLVKEGIVLEKDVKVEFKVVKNHAWGEEYPSENYKFSAEETGTYTVTINFNADSKEITIALEKTGEAVIGEKTYSVVGTLTTWDDDVDMTWNEEDKVYTALFENVPAGKYELKVRVNHDWGENYGDNGDNYVLELEKDAATLFITFDPETKAVSHIIPGEVAINSVKAAKKFDGTIFNVAGQKVNASYKGLVIKNGKKYIQK